MWQPPIVYMTHIIKTKPNKIAVENERVVKVLIEHI